MKKITLSTNGTFRGRECQDVESIDFTRFFGSDQDHDAVEVSLTPSQALGLGMELLYQAVDAGLIAAWCVSFPERVLQADAR